MTLAESINLALRSNRSIKSAYLDRVVQKFALKVARDKFYPDVTLDIGPTHSRSTSKTYNDSNTAKTKTITNNLNSTLSLSQKIQTGGDFSFSWNRADQLTDTNGTDENRTSSRTWQVSFTQPLLRGMGIDVNQSSIALAELAEQSNLLSLRANITQTVVAVINAFRSFGQTARRVEIIKKSVERAKRLLEVNRFLISVGRMPANELIQTESDVANQEFSYETALNSLDNSRLNLLKVLDIDKHTLITPVEEADFTPVHPDLEKCLKVAFENRVDYLNQLISMERAKINMMLAKNNVWWDLDFQGRYGFSDNYIRHGSDTDNHQWQVGVSLSIPLYGDLSRKQNLLSAETALKKAQLSNEETRENIEIEVRDAIREVETRLKQVGMAKRARELAEKKLKVEEEKLKVGRSTNFQLVSFQNQLVDIQNEELNANIAYRNALTSLDRILGTTLQTWQIEYNRD